MRWKWQWANDLVRVEPDGHVIAGTSLRSAMAVSTPGREMLTAEWFALATGLMHSSARLSLTGV